MMLNIKHKIVTAALLLVFVAPVVRMPEVFIDFGPVITMRPCGGSGGGC